MSIKARNRLAAAATVLAVLGLLAAMQYSPAPSITMKAYGRMADDGRIQNRTQHGPADSRLVEYQ
jgi:hypothetical protein